MIDLPEKNPLFHDVGDDFAMTGNTGSSSLFGDIFSGISGFAEGAAGAAESVFGSLSAYEAAASEYNNPGGTAAALAAAQAKQTQTYLLIGVGVIALILILK